MNMNEAVFFFSGYRFMTLCLFGTL